MKTIDISDDAFDFLQGMAVPLEDSTVSVLDRLIAEHRNLTLRPGQNSTSPEVARLDMSFNIGNLPNVSFTTLISAKLKGQPTAKLYWNDILEEMIGLACKSGASPNQLKASLSLQIREGHHDDNGYRHVPEAGLSFQGVDAVRACKNIATLSKEFDIPVLIELRWQQNPKAQFAGQTGRLVFP